MQRLKPVVLLGREQKSIARHDFQGNSDDNIGEGVLGCNSFQPSM